MLLIDIKNIFCINFFDKSQILRIIQAPDEY